MKTEINVGTKCQEVCVDPNQSALWHPWNLVASQRKLKPEEAECAQPQEHIEERNVAT